MKVSILPIMMRQSRARDNRTFKRSGAFMNPMSPFELLRVSDTMTMSRSSP